MRSYVLAREPEGLRRDLGSSAGEVARIVSEVPDRLHVEPSPASPADAEEERYRLFQAVSFFLRIANPLRNLRFGELPDALPRPRTSARGRNVHRPK
jgi:hypothetical protein